jgi:hypothetical protein
MKDIKLGFLVGLGVFVAMALLGIVQGVLMRSVSKRG